MKLTMAIEKYIHQHKAKCSADKTIQNYRDILGGFVRYVGDIEVSEITIDLLQDYQVSLYDRGLRKATVGTYMRHIKAFLHYLGENCYINEENLYKRIKLPRKSKKVLAVFSPEEIDTIFNCITVQPEWLRLRNCSIIALMLDSGLRQQEICNLNSEDINLLSNLVRVSGKGDKERFVPLGKATRGYVKGYLSECPYSNKYLFCSKTGERINTNTIKLFVSKLKKDTHLNFSSHKLRHNFATNYCLNTYEKNGYIDIYKLMVVLGHEDIETTRIYLHMANQYIAATECISHLDMIYDL